MNALHSLKTRFLAAIVILMVILLVVISRNTIPASATTCITESQAISAAQTQTPPEVAWDDETAVLTRWCHIASTAGIYLHDPDEQAWLVGFESDGEIQNDEFFPMIGADGDSSDNSDTGYFILRCSPGDELGRGVFADVGPRWDYDDVATMSTGTCP